MLLTAWETVKLRPKKLGLIVLCFLAFWLPWAFSPRIMFLYHFSPSIPFLSLGFILQDAAANAPVLAKSICKN